MQAKNHVQAIVFDYGNTLVEFGKRQTAAFDEAYAGAVREIFGPLDIERFRAVRDRNRLAPYAGDQPEYRENDLRVITRDLIRELYGVEASSGELERILQRRFDVFVSIVEAGDDVKGLLERLHGRYRLGLLSNYPDGAAIRASLRNVGLAPLFDAVVVSGDLGFAKPHPLPFQTLLKELGLPAQEALFVGDNWLADVQGGKRAGMPVVQTVQWAPYERFARKPGDLEPDHAIEHILELEDYLAGHD